MKGKLNFIKNSLLIAFLFSLIVYIIFQFIPYHKYSSKNPWMNTDKYPILIGDGGMLYPDNSFENFDYLKSIGVNLIVLDVAVTKDGVAVANNNLPLEMQTDATGRLSDYTYEELSKLNFGSKFVDINNNTPYKDQVVALPKLEEVFAKYKENTRFLINITNDNYTGDLLINSLIKVMAESDVISDAVVTSSNEYLLQSFHEKTNGKIYNSASILQIEDFTLATYLGYNLFYRPNYFGLVINEKEEFVKLDVPVDSSIYVWKAHRHNLFVYYKDVNDISNMKQMIKIKADGIITARPDIYLELINK